MYCLLRRLCPKSNTLGYKMSLICDLQYGTNIHYADKYVVWDIIRYQSLVLINSLINLMVICNLRHFGFISLVFVYLIATA